MAASYPTSSKSFSTKSTTDVVEASHPNDLQDEVTAIETDLLAAFPGGLAAGVVSGTFTGTLTGVSGTVTVTVRYTKTGDAVQLDVPQLSGTSTATTKTLTGMPAAIRPTITKTQCVFANDNGGSFVAAPAELASTGTIAVYATANFGAWTASGTATISGFQMSYELN